MEENNARFYTQHEAVIGKRHVFHHLVSVQTLGIDIHVIEWEDSSMELQHVFIDNNDKAEKKFNAVCKRILNEK